MILFPMILYFMILCTFSFPSPVPHDEEDLQNHEEQNHGEAEGDNEARYAPGVLALESSDTSASARALVST